MTLYYAASTGGFYDSDIHGTAIPKDAVEMTPEQHRALLEANAKGARIEANAQGYPQAIFPSEEEQTAQKAERIRTERNALLKDSDWTQLTDIPLSALQVSDKWLAYRQALRDIPQQAGFPNQVTWPEPPTGQAQSDEA